MKDSALNSNYKIPFHTHKGRNIWRILVLILLTTIVLFSIYSFKYVGFIMIMVIIACLFGIVCIRFPKIYLYDDYFKIVRKCLIDRFSDKDVFKYKDLIKVEFSEGYTDWIYLMVIAIFGSGGFGSDSKADQMIVSTVDNKSFVFNRFGSRKAFIETLDLINKKIRPATNNV